MKTNTTLNEEIKNIVTNEYKTKAEKLTDIVKLGIPMWQAEVVYNVALRNADKDSFTFGVEIEMSHTNRVNIENACRESGVAINYEGYNHRDGHSYYKFTTDSSLEGTNPMECVSPVLKGNGGLDSLKSLVNSLNMAGCRVNKSCGLHVHVGAEGLTEEQYCSVFVNYMHLERVIDTFMAASRRGNESRWCHTLVGTNIQRVYSRSYIVRALHGDRYHKVNPMSYDRHKTIEFRQHGGSLNYEKIKAWVMFVGKLVNWSKDHRLTDDVTSIDDIAFITEEEKAYFKMRAAALAA